MMLLVNVPWSKRVWALPFLSLLAPHEKTNQALGKRHKTSIDWVQHMTSQVRRWLPDRPMVLLTDGGLIAVRLGLRCNHYAQAVIYVSRLHLNIRLFDPPLTRLRQNASHIGQRQPNLGTRLTDPNTAWTRQTVAWYGGKQRRVEWVSDTALWQTPSLKKSPLPIRWVLVRDPLGKFKAAAFCCTDLTISPEQIIAWYVLRWNVEVTFEDCRAHLAAQHPLPTRSAAWYTKSEATFADVIAFVRRYLWLHLQFPNPQQNTRLVPFPASVLDSLLDALCYAA